MILLLLACTEEPVPTDSGPAPEPLPIPDLTGVDLPAAYAEILRAALGVDMSVAWRGHAASLTEREAACPNLWTGSPDDQMGDEEALTWSDRCSTNANVSFGGTLQWENALQTTREGTGTTTTGSRSLSGDGVVSHGDEVLFEFDGEGSDAFTLIEDGDYQRWTYNSLVQATVTGTLPFPDGPTGGWRTDLNLELSGGDGARVAARGNVFFFEHRIQDRFDSGAMDLEMPGPGSADPEDCALEPHGTLSLRDEDAIWYDLVFLPLYEEGDYADDPYAVCDGCATLYVRGQEQPELVCPDLSWLFVEAPTPPEPADYALSVRDP